MWRKRIKSPDMSDTLAFIFMENIYYTPAQSNCDEPDQAEKVGENDQTAETAPPTESFEKLAAVADDIDQLPRFLILF